MSPVSYEDIVTVTDRPTLVLAGPGAGKTYLLADRVRRLLDAGVDHASMTLLTFGKDASQNMKNKLLDPAHGFGLKHDQLPHVSTMHSLGFEVVNRKPRSVGLRKADLRVQPDSYVVGLLFRDAALSLGLSEDLARNARRCKERGDCRPREDDAECRVCGAYWSIMQKCNCIDFDDQVLFACRILEDDSQLLGEYRLRCQHLIVDEYQDINAAQFRLIELLSRESQSGLFVVGDDAQSIYGFRGATPEFILRFTDDFQGAWKPPLPYSRRCHEGILGKAQGGLDRHYDEWSGPEELEYTMEPGDEPKVWHVPSENAEAHWAARLARQAVGEGKTVLILAPKSAFFSRLSRMLSQYGVPHDCRTSLLAPPVMRRLSVVWDLLEWLRDPSDSFRARVALERVINNGAAKVPGAGKGRRCTPGTIERRNAIEKEIASLWDLVTSRKNLVAALKSHREHSKDLSVARAVLSELEDSFADSRGKEKGEFARRLSVACGGWVAPDSLSGDLLSVRDELLGGKVPGFSSVQLMSLRRAKGLEADVVVMVGLEDDIIPGADPDVAEQARLFYVGMTRATESLYMIHSYKRPRDVSFGMDIVSKKRSRFLDALGIDSHYLKERAKTA